MNRPVGRNFQRGFVDSRSSYGMGFGAAQGPQKLWGIWNKILKSSNFQALLSNFRKVMFFKTDYMIFTKFFTNLSINFKKNIDFNSDYLFSRGGSTEPLEPPLATGVMNVK